jgi:hypothetical protein
MPALRQSRFDREAGRIDDGKTDSRYSRGCRSNNSQLGMETMRA